MRNNTPNMSIREQLKQIKKRSRTLSVSAIIAWCINGAAWIIAALTVKRFIGVFMAVLFISMVLIITVWILIDRRIAKNRKSLVEEFAGVVSDEDKKLAQELLKKWTSCYLKSIKWVLSEFREEVYPHGQTVIGDLASLKKGIKVDAPLPYPWLDRDEPNIPEIIKDICMLMDRNSYTL